MKNSIKSIIKAKWFDLRGKKYGVDQHGHYLFLASKKDWGELGFSYLMYKGKPIIQRKGVSKNEVWFFDEDELEIRFLDWKGWRPRKQTKEL